MRNILTITFITLVLFYLLAALVLVLVQDRHLFYPRPLSFEAKEALAARPAIKPLSLIRPGGVTLRGWLRTLPHSEPGPLLIYFGGNAEEVSRTLIALSGLTDHVVAAFNYRGYGESEGKPGQKNMYEDALALYDFLTERGDVDPSRVKVMGYSLGSAMATYLAAHRPLESVVLLAPFDSILNVARAAYPIFPVRLLLRHPFDSLKLAPRIAVPLLCILAEADEVIPRSRSERLMQAWMGPKQVVMVPGAGHNDLLEWPGLVEALRTFLKGH